MLSRRFREKNGKTYFHLTPQEVVPPTGVESRFYPVATKLVIPVTVEMGEVPLKTCFETSKGIHEDSHSVARPGEYVVINQPPAALARHLIASFNARADQHAPSRRLDALLSDARAQGLNNIYPAPSDVMESYAPVDGNPIDAAQPGLYRPRYPRAVSRMEGPVMLDQTQQWGPDADGQPNLQVQDDTVFIFELDKNGAPLYTADGTAPRVRLYDITPFSDEYVTHLKEAIQPTKIPLVTLRGELSGQEKNVQRLLHHLR